MLQFKDEERVMSQIHVFCLIPPLLAGCWQLTIFGSVRSVRRLVLTNYNSNPEHIISFLSHQIMDIMDVSTLRS
jgi:hypothetical protein